jgi:HlyD family secretion protein
VVEALLAGKETGMNEQAEITIEPGQPTITLKRVFDAPRHLVFEAWTKPEHVTRWYDLRNFTMSDCKIDFRVGGKWRVALHAPNGQDHGFSGEYREIVTPERVVQTFHYDGAPNDEATETLVFLEEDAKTILTSTVTHTSVENRDRHVRSGMREAAAQILDNLADHLRAPAAKPAKASDAAQTMLHEQTVETRNGAAARAKWDWRLAAALGILIIGGGLYWSSHRGAAASYVTEAVDRGSVTRTLSATGVVNSRPAAQLGASVSGRIEALFCDPDAVVKTGQLCAKIDQRPFQAALNREKAAIGVAEARLKKSRTRLDRAKAAFEREQILASRGTVSQTALGKARSAYEQAREHTKLDEAEIVQHRESLRAAEIDLAHTNIVSPIDGKIVSRNVEIGQMIEANKETSLFVIAPDLSAVQVDAKLSINESAQIKLGDKASFTVDAVPDHVFWGEIKQIGRSPQAVQETAMQDTAMQDVVIGADNHDLSLEPGMRAAIQIVVDRRENVIRAPDRSLLYSISKPDAGAPHLEAPPDGWVRLWVLRNGTPTAVTIRPGLDDGAYTEVIEGDLQPGDQLILG